MQRKSIKVSKKSIKKVLKIPVEILTVLGKDKSLQLEFQEFMEDKSKPPTEQELSKHGGSLSSTMGDYYGNYNPEIITIDTFSKMKKNFQIASGLQFIKFPVIGQHWSVVSKDKDIADFITTVMRPLWYNLITTSLTAIEFGFSAHEIVYGIEDIKIEHRDQSESTFTKAVIPKKFKSLYPEHILIKLDDKENFDGFIQNFGGEKIIIPSEKSFIFTNLKGESFGNLYGTSRLVSCYDIWYWWVSMATFMLRYFERKGTPPIIVRFPSGKTKDGTNHSDIAFSLGKALLSESVVAMTSSTYPDSKDKKWDINYLMDDKRGDMFINVLADLEAKMLRGMFVPERIFTQNNAAGGSGSYALSKVHADMFMLGEEALIVDLENQINKYIVSRLVQYNFGIKAPECLIQIERITDARKTFLKEVFMEMLKSGNAAPAVKEIAETLGVPVSDEENQEQIKDGDKKEKKDKKDKLNINSQKKEDNTKLSLSEDNIRKIEKYIDKRQEELKLEFKTEILDKQIQWVIEEIELIDKKKLPLKDFWFQEIKTKDIFGNEMIEKKAWQPLRSKLLSKLYDLMETFFIYGFESVVEELSLDFEPKINSEYKDIFKAKSIALGDRFFSNLKYETEIVLLMPHNKTLQDIISEIKGKIKDKLEVEIDSIIETESFWSLNLGRKFVVDFINLKK